MSLREELLAQGCVEKVLKRKHKTVYYENSIGIVIAKKCTKCMELKLLEMYNKRKDCLGGKEPTCRYCKSKLSKRYRKENPEKLKAQKKKWLENNPDYQKSYYKKNQDALKSNMKTYYKENRESIIEKVTKYRKNNTEKITNYRFENRIKRSRQSKNWRLQNYEHYKEYKRVYEKENPQGSRLRNHRRRARKRMLPNDLTHKQQNAILTHFNNACALSGETTDLHLDHVIPLATGHGGTTYGNMIPLRGDLNCSKNDSNLFEWFESNWKRFELSRKRFDALVKYLADVNEMTVEEYVAYYNGCFEDKAKEESA